MIDVPTPSWLFSKTPNPKSSLCHVFGLFRIRTHWTVSQARFRPLGHRCRFHRSACCERHEVFVARVNGTAVRFAVEGCWSDQAWLKDHKYSKYCYQLGSRSDVGAAGRCRESYHLPRSLYPDFWYNHQRVQRFVTGFPLSMISQPKAVVFMTLRQETSLPTCHVPWEGVGEYSLEVAAHTGNDWNIRIYTVPIGTSTSAAVALWRILTTL